LLVGDPPVDMADVIERACADGRGAVVAPDEWWIAIAGRIKAMQLDIEQATAIRWSEPTPEEDPNA
jgi:hypothetical protein